MPGNLLKNLEKSWKYHGILSVRKSGNPECRIVSSVYQASLFQNTPYIKREVNAVINPIKSR